MWKHLTLVSRYNSEHIFTIHCVMLKATSEKSVLHTMSCLMKEVISINMLHSCYRG